MIIFLYTIICAAFLNECNAVLNHGSSSGINSYLASSSNNDLEYQRYPIRFACITSNSQTEFYMIDVNGSIPSALVDQLDNGKGLSLFFQEATNIVDSSNELLASFVSEWSMTSKNNVCIVTYAYTSSLSNGLEVVAVADKMVSTQRLEYVANLVGDVVLGVQGKCVKSKRKQCLRHLAQVDVSGFGLGAHIAGRTCQYLKRKLRQRVRILLALDPIKTPLLGTTIKDTIKRGDADYVQVIHTSKKVGIWDQLGDIDVYVKYEPDTDSGAFNDDHLIAFFIHIATSTKRLFLTGELNETGIGNVSRTQPNTALTECTIGIYGSLLMKNRFKKFGISLENRNPVFWGGIGPFGKTEIFSGTQSETRENESSDSDDDDCSICYNNKVNARLSCDHEMCDTCWDTWQNTPSSKNKCPMCKQTVTSVDKI